MTLTIRISRWGLLALVAGTVALLLVLSPVVDGVSISNAAATVCPPPPAPPRITGAAMQRYERGYMVWVQDTDMFYVMYGDQFSGTFETYPDTWQEGMPETDPNIVPPPGLFQPTRGGGHLWRTNQKVRDGLGWGIEPPTGFTMLIEQRGDKIWFNGQGYDVFSFSGNRWQEHDVWRK
jgi:hypothetical protein